MISKTVYVAPVTERFQVELEGGLMAASIYEEKEHQDGVSSSAQEYESFNGTGGFVVNDNGSIWE